MRTSRKLATLGLGITVTGALFAGSATAQTVGATAAAPGSYRATAVAEALHISLLGQEIAGSKATALVDSTPVARGTATNLLVGPVAEVIAEQPGGAPTAAIDPCTGAALAALPGINRLDLT